MSAPTSTDGRADVLVCDVCGKPSECTCPCALRNFCGRDCQLIDWPTHKDECTKSKKNRKKRKRDPSAASGGRSTKAVSDADGTHTTVADSTRPAATTTTATASAGQSTEETSQPLTKAHKSSESGDARGLARQPVHAMTNVYTGAVSPRANSDPTIHSDMTSRDSELIDARDAAQHLDGSHQQPNTLADGGVTVAEGSATTDRSHVQESNPQSNTIPPALLSAPENGSATSARARTATPETTHNVCRTTSHSSYTGPSDHADTVDSSATNADVLDSSVTTSPSVDARQKKSTPQVSARAETDTDNQEATNGTTDRGGRGFDGGLPNTQSAEDHGGGYDSDEPQILFPCGYKGCTALFEDNARWREHAATHLSAKAYPCRMSGCGEGFSDEEAFKAHIFEHTALRCPRKGCGRLYATVGKLKAHVQLRHKSRKKRS